MRISSLLLNTALEFISNCLTCQCFLWGACFLSATVLICKFIKEKISLVFSLSQLLFIHLVSIQWERLNRDDHAIFFFLSDSDCLLNSVDICKLTWTNRSWRESAPRTGRMLVSILHCTLYKIWCHVASLSVLSEYQMLCYQFVFLINIIYN